MRAVIQRVLRGAVSVEAETVGSIGKGIFVLVGIDRDDTQDDMDYITRKILSLRIWPNAEGKDWTLNVMETGGGVLVVSQFTLMHVLKGNKPDFHLAMSTEQASEMFNRIYDKLRAEYQPDRVATGKFGHYMNIDIVNDGPVTLCLDSKRKG